MIVPGTIDLSGNSQITGRTSPGLLDLTAAVATGLAGAVGLSRRDVAAVLPGVAIAISLVPPLAVVGVCLGEGDLTSALGALLLFVSNLVALVLAGTILFAALGYSHAVGEEPRIGAGFGGYAKLFGLFLLVGLPLAVNTAGVYVVHLYSSRVEHAGNVWVAPILGAEVIGVEGSPNGFTLTVRTPEDPPPVSELMDSLAGEVPSFFTVTVETTTGRRIDAGPVPEEPGAG
jgi:hypothetical protein